MDTLPWVAAALQDDVQERHLCNIREEMAGTLSLDVRHVTIESIELKVNGVLLRDTSILI